jgi:hypothetical protein
MELHSLVHNAYQLKGNHFEYLDSVATISERYQSLEWWKDGGILISVNDYSEGLSYIFGVNKNQDTLTKDTSMFKDISKESPYCLSFGVKKISFYNQINKEKIVLSYKLLSQVITDSVLVGIYQIECDRRVWEISVRGDSVLNVKIGFDSVLNVKNTPNIIADNVYNIYTHKKADAKKAKDLKKYKSSIFSKCKSFRKTTSILYH